MNGQHVKLGIFVVAGILLFVLGIFFISKNEFSFARSYKVEALFKNAGGLDNGAQVRVAGINKGVVEQLLVPADPSQPVRVVMKMQEDTRQLINPATIAHIKSQGFFGERYIELELKDAKDPGAIAQTNPDVLVIRGTEIQDMDKLIADANATINSIKDTSNEYRELAVKIHSGQGTIGKLLNDRELYDNVNASVKSVENSSAKLQQIVNHIRSGKGTLGNLVYGKELTPEISATIADARESAQRLTAILNEIDSGQGTVGRLIKDEAMANDLAMILTSGRAAAANLEEILNKINNGEGPLGDLIAGDGSKTIGGIGGTIKEAHNAVTQMNEVLTAAKTNFLLRGYFEDRGYFNVKDLTNNQFDEPANAKVIKQYTFSVADLFGRKSYVAKLKNHDPLYPIGVYLMNQNYSVVAIKVYLSPVGKVEDNRELSQARAYVIREYLAKNFPIDEAKLKIKGYGEDYEVNIPQERGAGWVRIIVYE